MIGDVTTAIVAETPLFFQRRWAPLVRMFSHTLRRCGKPSISVFSSFVKKALVRRSNACDGARNYKTSTPNETIRSSPSRSSLVVSIPRKKCMGLSKAIKHSFVTQWRPGQPDMSTSRFVIAMSSTCSCQWICAGRVGVHNRED